MAAITPPSLSSSEAAATYGSVVLYDASPAVSAFSNQEVVKVIGSAGANPCRGTFIPTTANPRFQIELRGSVYGGAMVNTMLVVGVRAGNDPTLPIAKPDPTAGT